jgi:hypothetical protein
MRQKVKVSASGPKAASASGDKFSKVCSSLTLPCKYRRALTFENFCSEIRKTVGPKEAATLEDKNNSGDELAV